jgi:restriction endonuclease S subunit/predicted GIY-YIG superfamily endonuclease
MSKLETGLHYPLKLETLPPDWQAGYVGNFADEIQPGFASGKHNKEGAGIPHIRPFNIDRQGKLDLSEIKSVAPDSDTKRLRTGDVLFNNTNSPELIGKTAVIASAGDWGFSNHMTRIRFKDDVAPKFAAYQLHFLWMTGYYLHNCVKHVNQASISSKTLANAVPFIAPPLDQQKRIVAEIEKQFSRLDEAVANLKRVKANLKRYKAAVLKAAVEGRLVETEAELARRLLARGAQASEGRGLPTPRPGVFYVYAIRCNDDSIYIGHTDNLARRWEEHLAGQAADWTKQHKPIQIVHYEEYQSRQEAADREKWLKTGYGRKWIKREIEAGRARPACAPRAGKQVGYETGEQLLQRILETRRQQWLARAEQAGGKGKGKYKEPAAPDTSDLPELPEGWCWATVEQLSGLVEYGSSAKTREDTTGVPVLRMGNIVEGELVFDELKYLPTKHDEFPKLLLQPGDLLFNRTNSPELVGKTAVFAGFPQKCSFASYLIRVRLVEGSTPKYLAAYINSSHGRNWVKSVVTQQVGQANVNGTKLQALAVPLPPEPEQQRIVAEMDRRLSLIRETESQIDANIQRSERMRQSILGKAFSGGFSVVNVDVVTFARHSNGARAR